MCDKINTLFNKIGESFVQSAKAQHSWWMIDGPFRGGNGANFARALVKWRAEVDEAREALVAVEEDESVDVREKERAWLRLSFCEAVVCPVGQIDFPWAAVKRCVSTGYAWDGSKCTLTSIESRFDLEALFPRDVSMYVDDELRVLCDQMMMVKGFDRDSATQLEREFDVHCLVVMCDYETGEMLWTRDHPADDPEWLPVFHRGGCAWGAFAEPEQARGPDEALTFAERCLGALRQRFETVEVAEDGSLVCTGQVVVIEEDDEEEAGAGAGAVAGAEEEAEAVDEAEAVAEMMEAGVTGKRKCEEDGGDAKKVCTTPQ